VSGDPQTQAIRNALTVFVGQLVGRLLDLWAVLLVARHFGEAGYGRFSFAFACVGYFAVVTEMGFHMVFVREQARHPQRVSDLLAAMLAVRLVLSAVCATLSAVFVLLPGYPEETVYLVWLLLPALVVSSKMPSIRQVYEQVFQARLLMQIPMTVRLLESLLLVGLLYAFLRPGISLPMVMALYMIGFVPGTLFVMGWSRRLVRPAARIDPALIRHLFAQALPLILLAVFAVFAGRIDVLLLSFWRDDAEIGYYSAAYRLTEALRIFPTAVLMSLFPLVSRAAVERPDAVKGLLDRSIKPLLILLIPVCVVTTCAADAIVELLYTETYIPAGRSLSTLVWGEIAAVFNLLIGQTLIALDRRCMAIGIAFLQLVINVVLNTVLIPSAGHAGAAVASVMTGTVGMIVYSLTLRRITGWSVEGILKPLLPATAVIGITGYALSNASPVIAGVVCVVVYTFALFASRGVTRADVEPFREALSGK